MRRLTSIEIEECASRRGANRIAVENFLGSMPEEASVAYGNVQVAARRNGWTPATTNAIRAGIALANKGG